jgi:hypothetical protein
LASGALEEHHEHLGGRAGHRGAQVVLDEAEGEVDARRDAGRGEHVAVAHEQRLVVDIDGGEPPGECGGVAPVGGGSAAVEQAGGCERERAGADRHDAPGVACKALDLADDLGVEKKVPVRRAGDEQGVDVTGAQAFEGDVGAQAVAGRGDDVSPAEGGHPGDVVVALLVGHREHLERAHDIEEPDTVVRHDHDPAGILGVVRGKGHDVMV